MFEILFGVAELSVTAALDAATTNKTKNSAGSAEFGTKDKVLVGAHLAATLLVVVGCVASANALKAERAAAATPVMSAK